MRNLRQYPIKKEEVLSCLERLKNKMLKPPLQLGNTDAACLAKAIEIVNANWEDEEP